MGGRKPGPNSARACSEILSCGSGVVINKLGVQLTISRWRSCSAPCTDHRNRNSRLNMHQHHRSLPRKPSLPYSFLGSSLSLHPSHGLALNRYHYTKWLLSLALKLAIERVANEADKWFSAYQFRLYTHRDFIQAKRFANCYWQQPLPTCRCRGMLSNSESLKKIEIH